MPIWPSFTKRSRKTSTLPCAAMPTVFRRILCSSFTKEETEALRLQYATFKRRPRRQALLALRLH